jgi:hypothetical protein
MKNYIQAGIQIKDLDVLTRQGGDDDDDGGGTDANPTQPDYADPDSQA